MAALKLRGPKAKILTSWLCRRRNDESVPLRRRFLRCLSFLSSPGVWAEDNPLPPRRTQDIPPMVAELKPGAIPVSQRQYYIPCKTQIGIQKHLDRLLKYAVL
jgi:hypothetical protein